MSTDRVEVEVQHKILDDFFPFNRPTRQLQSEDTLASLRACLQHVLS